MLSNNEKYIFTSELALAISNGLQVEDGLKMLVGFDADVSICPEQAIRECASKQEGVVRVDMLKTRVFGNKIYVDIEIGADGNETLRDAHAVAERVHDHIEKEFPKVKHIMVHVNPA